MRWVRSHTDIVIVAGVAAMIVFDVAHKILFGSHT